MSAAIMYKRASKHVIQYAHTTACLMSLHQAVPSRLNLLPRFHPTNCSIRSLRTTIETKTDSKDSTSETININEIVSSVIRDSTPSSPPSSHRNPTSSDRFVRRPRSTNFGRHFLKPGQPTKVATYQQIFDKMEQVRFTLSKLRSDNPTWTDAQLQSSPKYQNLVKEADELLERLFEPIAANPTKASVRLWSRDFRDIFFMIKELQLFNHTWRFFQLFQLHQQLQWRWRKVKHAREEKKQNKTMHTVDENSSRKTVDLKIPPVSDRLIGLMLYCLAHSPQQGPGVASAELEWMCSPRRAKWFQIRESHFRVILQAYIEAGNKTLGLPQKLSFRVNQDKTHISLRSAKLPPSTSEQLAEFVTHPITTFYNSIPHEFSNELQAFQYAAFLASLHKLDKADQVLVAFQEKMKKPPQSRPQGTAHENEEVTLHDEPLDDNPFAQALKSDPMTAQEEAEEEAAEKAYQAKSAQRKGNHKK